MAFSKSLLPVCFLLALYGLPAVSQDASDGLTMAQVEEAWSAGDFVTVREGLKALAENEGSPFAKYRYGRVLLEGRGGPADLMAARDWLEQAAADNQLDAAVLLARLYLSRADGGPDYAPERAATLLKTAAARGNAEAQYYLGLLYGNGTGLEQSPEDMLTWMLAAAENGHVDAMFKLSQAYSRGLGGPVDVEKAVKWLESAASNGHAEAQYYMAYALDTGQGMAQDRAGAANWLLRSAEAGFWQAQAALGRKYLKGDGIAANPVEGLRWLRAAAETGNPAALADLAEAYTGTTGATANPALAMQLYAQAADAGLPRAMIGLAQMLEQGAGGQLPDMEQAISLYRRAVEAGSEEASLKLGQLAGAGRLDGLLAPHRAVPWAMSAAEAGDEAALNWLRARADEGLRPALTAMAEWMLSHEGSADEAAGLLRTAAEAGDTDAQHQLGLLLIKGQGVEQDYVQAHKWLNIAAAGGNQAALEMREVAADLMTAEQVAEAQKAARTFFDQARAPVGTDK